jgi:AraC-like DNA-binding protein
VSRETEEVNGRLVRTRPAMNHTYAEPVDVRAAAVAQLSEADSRRGCRSACGEAPHWYLQRGRVERSRFRVGETDRSITDPCFGVRSRSCREYEGAGQPG